MAALKTFLTVTNTQNMHTDLPLFSTTPDAWHEIKRCAVRRGTPYKNAIKHSCHYPFIYNDTLGLLIAFVLLIVTLHSAG